MHSCLTLQWVYRCCHGVTKALLPLPANLFMYILLSLLMEIYYQIFKIKIAFLSTHFPIIFVRKKNVSDNLNMRSKTSYLNGYLNLTYL